MSPHHKQFITYREISALPITAANNKVFHAVGMGNLQIQVPNGVTSTRVHLKDTLHAADLGLAVVSIRCIVKAGYTLRFTKDTCNIEKGDKGPVIGPFQPARWLVQSRTRIRSQLFYSG
jgi:Pol polyprotein